jgi:hypothetical protein
MVVGEVWRRAVLWVRVSKPKRNNKDNRKRTNAHQFN